MWSVLWASLMNPPFSLLDIMLHTSGHAGVRTESSSGYTCHVEVPTVIRGHILAGHVVPLGVSSPCLIFPQGALSWGAEQVQQGVIYTSSCADSWAPPHCICHIQSSLPLPAFTWKGNTGSKYSLTCFLVCALVLFAQSRPIRAQLLRIMDKGTMCGSLRPHRVFHPLAEDRRTERLPVYKFNEWNISADKWLCTVRHVLVGGKVGHALREGMLEHACSCCTILGICICICAE